jgi:predicted nucleic-acid-binding protein
VIALDTSVLARLLIGDDPAQLVLAQQLVSENDCLVSWSVLVELCWVMERSANLPRIKVAAALRLLQGMDGVTFLSDDGFDWALARYEDGADFADMIHLVAAQDGSQEFATFDRKLARQAGANTPISVRTLRA